VHIWRLRIYGGWGYAQLLYLHIYGSYAYTEVAHIRKIHVYFVYAQLLYMAYILYMHISFVYAQLSYMRNFSTCEYLSYICIYYICATSRYAHIQKICTYMEDMHIYNRYTHIQKMYIYISRTTSIYAHIMYDTSFVYAELSYMCIQRSYTYTKVALIQRLCTTSTFSEGLEKCIRPLSRMARRWLLKRFRRG